MINDRLPDPSDLAITLSQRLADLLSPAEMGRLRVMSPKHCISPLVATAVDMALITGGDLNWQLLDECIAWALELYGHEYSPREHGPIRDIVRESIRIARSHGYVVEAILDSQEATP